jgi:hypothetical protein
LSDKKLKFPEWQAPFQELILEFDREKLPEKIQQVETLIVTRLQELSSYSNYHSERQAIADALFTLRLLKKGRLSLSPS